MGHLPDDSDGERGHQRSWILGILDSGVRHPVLVAITSLHDCLLFSPYWGQHLAYSIESSISLARSLSTSSIASKLARHFQSRNS